MKLAIILAALVLTLFAIAGFRGIEIINHAGGPMYVEITCMDEGYVKHKGIIGNGDRESISITCPRGEDDGR